jgi:anaerobic selenocysteine-containing dehydrogenase
VVVTRDDKIAHVRGDPTHPISRGKLCAKCSIAYNREWLDPQVRLTRPLRRIGTKRHVRVRPLANRDRE